MVLLTRRRDQVTYNGGPCGDQLIGGIIICETREARDKWIGRLNVLHPLRFNYFVLFDDVHGPALQFGHAAYAEHLVSAQRSEYYINHPYIQ